MMSRPPSKSLGNRRIGALEPDENRSSGVLVNGDVNHVEEQSVYSRPVNYRQPELRRFQFEVDVLKRTNVQIKSGLMQKGADHSVMPTSSKTDGQPPFQYSSADAYSQAQIDDIPDHSSQGHASHDQQQHCSHLRNSSFVSYRNLKAFSQKPNLQVQNRSPDTQHTVKLQTSGPPTSENNSLRVHNPEMGDSASTGRMQQQLTTIKEQCGGLADKYNELVGKLQDCQIAYYCLTKQNIELEVLNMELQRSLEMMQQAGRNFVGVSADECISECTPGYNALSPVESCADLMGQVALPQTAIDPYCSRSSSLVNNVLPHELPAYGLGPERPCSPQNMGMLRGRYRPSVVSADVYGSPTSVLQAPDLNNRTRTSTSTASFNVTDDRHYSTVKDKCPIPDDDKDHEATQSSTSRVTPHVPKMISIRANGGSLQNMLRAGRLSSSKGFARRPAPQSDKASTPRSADHMVECPDTMTRSPKPASATSASAGFIPKRPQRIRLMRPLVSTNDVSRQDDDKMIECVAFPQGMYKTELCDKWNEGGWCPYGERCQFAHGKEELRPVLRHPFYKTELCRMVAAGEACPYGHRCHFRHTLLLEEILALLSSN